MSKEHTSAKAAERPSFQSIYMDLAFSLARRSNCKRLQVGTVITSTDFRKVLAVGYNGNAAGHRRYPSTIVPHLQLVRRAVELGIRASFAVTVPIEELETAVLQVYTTKSQNQKKPPTSKRAQLLQRLLADAAHGFTARVHYMRFDSLFGAQEPLFRSFK